MRARRAIATRFCEGIKASLSHQHHVRRLWGNGQYRARRGIPRRTRTTASARDAEVRRGVPAGRALAPRHRIYCTVYLAILFLCSDFRANIPPCSSSGETQARVRRVPGVCLAHQAIKPEAESTPRHAAAGLMQRWCLGRRARGSRCGSQGGRNSPRPRPLRRPRRPSRPRAWPPPRSARAAHRATC